MKSRWAGCLICAALGLVLLAAGLFVPAYLRALDAGVVQSAGLSSLTLIEDGQRLAGEKRLGSAQMILQAARAENIPGSETLGANLADLLRQYPSAYFWGEDTALEKLFGGHPGAADQDLTAASFMIRRENRGTALLQLRDSQNELIRALLQTRSLAKTEIFAPSASAAGQAFDAAVAMTGLLVEGGYLADGLRADVLQAATGAASGGSSRPLEQILLDITSAGERFNWDQLTAFVRQIPSAGTLNQLAGELRRAGDQLPTLYAVVQISGQPSAVADYLAKYPERGLAELGSSLRYGAGGVGALALSQQPLYSSSFERSMTIYEPFSGFFAFAAHLCAENPLLARGAKWALYLLAGFFLAAAMHLALPAPAYPRPVPGFHLFRETLFALGFLLVVLILTEPFLARDNQKAPFTLRLLPPGVGGAIPAGAASLNQTFMNPTILLTLLVFFVLQALIYISCLVKLAEIRRQNVPARMKLKLLENEDHLFDAGLYLGFVGTIASLIMASMGLVKFSLMAAYSSTSFGIVFVVIFKIFHLRPARRALLIQAEADSSPAGDRRAAGPATVVTP